MQNNDITREACTLVLYIIIKVDNDGIIKDLVHLKDLQDDMCFENLQTDDLSSSEEECDIQIR